MGWRPPWDFQDELRAYFKAVIDGVRNMTTAHDSILQVVQAMLAELRTLKDKVTQLAAQNTQLEQSYQDIVSQLQAARQEVVDASAIADTALKDDASHGGSTGAQ